MKCAMAWRVAGRYEETAAVPDLGLAFHLANIFPVRERRLDAPCQSFSCLREPIDHRRIRPEFVFRVGNDDLGVRVERLVRFFLHQAEDMVGMEMRDENGIDL